MVKTESVRIPSSLGGQQLHTRIWEPEEPAKSVVVLVHGMSEHIGRYDTFARVLCGRGFAVIGASLLGHGLTAPSVDALGYFADRGGDRFLVEDIDRVRRYAASRWSELPCFIFSHSMGTFLTRGYLCTEAAKGLAGVVLAGTADQPAAVLNAGLFVAGTQKLLGMKKKPGKLLNSLSFGSYNKGFDPPMEGYAWLTKDENALKPYANDPMCGFCFTVGGFADMFKVMKRIGKKRNIRRMEKELPVLLISGSDDPVGGKGAGVRRVYERFLRCGMKNVKMKLYEGDRHELINELDRETVYDDIVGFFENNLK